MLVMSCELVKYCLRTGCYTSASPLLYLAGPIYKIYYDLSYDYLNFIIRLNYDGELQCVEDFCQEYRKLIYEHYLRQSYDFANKLYARKALCFS